MAWSVGKVVVWRVRSGWKFEKFTVSGAVYAEITPIKSENLADFQAFSNRHLRNIREIEVSILIL